MSASRSIPAALAALAMLVASLSPATAAGPSIGRLGVGGTGCPAGTVSASLTGGGSTLSLKFSKYRAAAGGARSFDRKACGVAVPFTVPAGQSVAIVGVQYAGRNKLPVGATATLQTETFFAGGRGPVVSKTFTSTGSYRFTSVASAPVWSACGASLNLRVNSSLRVNSPHGASASSSVATQDVSAGLVYLLKFRAC
jgi:hypothetical protein